MNILEELKTQVESELAQVSPKLKAYVTALETALSGAEADIKSHWIYYAVIAFVAALIGHKI